MFRCSMKDNKGNLWFGTMGAGIYKYDVKLFYQYAATEGLYNSFVMAMVQDSKGVIWTGTSDGVFYGDGLGFNTLAMPSFAGTNTVFGTAAKKLQVYSIACDKKGNTCFGTDTQGLWKYDEHSFVKLKCNHRVSVAVSNSGNNNYRQEGFISAIVIGSTEIYSSVNLQPFDLL